MESTQQKGIAEIWKDPIRTFSKSGTPIELVAFLPREAETLDLKQLEALQQAYDGGLDIEHENGRVIVGRKVLVYAPADVTRETERLRRSLLTHLGLEAGIH